MSNDTNVDILLYVSAEFWDKRPQYKVSIDGVDVIPPTEFDLNSGETKEIKFTHVFPESEEVTPALLKLHLLNKEPSDTKKDNYDDPDNFKIVADMLLTLKSIELDGIVLPIGLDYNENSDDVGYYLVDEPVEYKGTPNTTKIQGCNTMGWNGAYCFEFKVPIYLWILDQFK